MPFPPSPPRVSVITATYNWSSVLRCAVRSVLDQTCADFEMLVIGDGCTDDSAAVVAGFGDPRLRWDNLERNTGSQSAPNNRGIELARGEFIAYLGHDDVWHPTHLEKLVGALSATGADLAWSLTAQIGPPGSGVRNLRGVAPDGKALPDHYPPPSAIVHRRALIAELGGWKDFRTLTCGPDAEFVERVWNAGKRCVVVPELTVWKFPSAWRPGSYVEKPSFEQEECLRRLRAEPDFRYREALETASALVLNKVTSPTAIHAPRPLAELPPGWMVEQARRQRGLPAMELPAAPVNPEKARTRPSRWRAFVGRALRAALRRIGERP